MRTLVRHRRTVVGLYLLLTVASLPGCLRLGFDNSPEVFFVRDAEQLDRYRRFREDFGTDEAVRIVVSGPGLWTREGLVRLAEIEDAVASLPGVEEAVGLYGLHRWRLPEWPPTDPESFRTQITGDSLDRRGGWVSPDGRRIALVATLTDLTKTDERELLVAVEQLVGDVPPGIGAEVTGLPLVERALDRSLTRMAVRFLPLLGLLAVVLLALTLRRGAGSVAPLVLVAACLGPVFGTLGYLGARLNLVTVILVPLLFVIALAIGIHMLLRFRELTGRGLRPEEAILATYRDEGWAVFWTGVSTLVGFGSLVTSGAAPVRSLGVWAAGGLAFLTVAAFTLYPALLASGRRRRSAAGSVPGAGVGGFESVVRSWGSAGARWAVRRRRALFLGAAALALLAVAGTARLRVESNVLSYLPADHPVRVQLEGIQADGLGAVTLELVLELPEVPESEGDRPGFRDPGGLRGLAELSRTLRREPSVAGAVGAGDVLDEAIRRFVVEGEVDDNLTWLVLGLLQTDPEGRRLLSAVASPGGRKARISLLVPMLGFTDLEPLAAEAVRRAGERFPEAEVGVTGRYLLVLQAQRVLLQTLASSLGLTLACIAGMFWLLLRNGRFTLLVLVPNLLPVVFVVGLMGWTGVPLDSTTVIIAAVVLGLVVDDTLHSLGHFRRLAPRLGAAEAAVATLERTAPAHVLTSAILVTGFGVCGLSELIPIARFGLLASAALAVALAADLLLVPALLAGLPESAVARLGRSQAATRGRWP